MNNIHRPFLWLTGFALLLLQFSCEDVIEIDLEDSEAQLVIEANLREGTHDFTVNISRSGSYFSNESPETVEDATVVLSDEQGNNFPIPHVGGGLYSARVTASSGQSYTLQVSQNGQVYEASSELLAPVVLNGFDIEFQEETPFFDEGYLLYLLFNDPGGENNYYRVLHKINGVLQNDAEDIQVGDDALFNGASARLPLFQQVFTSGDSVEVEFVHLDEASYDYFNSLVDIISQGGGPGGASAAPGNPNTNWSGGCLGYFSAFSSSIQGLRIP